MEIKCGSILFICILSLFILPVMAGAQYNETQNIVNPGFENGTYGYYADLGKWQDFDDVNLVPYDYGAEVANTGHTGSHSYHFYSNQTGGTNGANGGDNMRFDQTTNTRDGDNVTITYYVKGHGQYMVVGDRNGPWAINGFLKSVDSDTWVKDSVTYTQQTDLFPGFGIVVAGRWGGDIYFDDFSVSVKREGSPVQENIDIYLKPASSERTSWAYYPYNPARPFTGGSWSPVYGGTATRWVKPGSSIYRKLIVTNNGMNTSVKFSVSGLPAAWGITVSPAVNVASGKNGYGSFVVTIPAGTAAGTYPYTITASAGSVKSSIPDRIIVT